MQVLTALETEVLVLRAATASLDEIVNRQLFDVVGQHPNREISFHTSLHQRLFNILLVDFLSDMDIRFSGPRQSALDALLSVSGAPQFNHAGSVDLLRQPVVTLSNWLEKGFSECLYLPSISREVQVNITRREIVVTCGNISKHNFTRLTATTKKIRQILARTGAHLADGEELLILDDFYNHFHGGVLNYHGSTLVELLNNVRWGIYEYFQPEFQRSYTPTGGDPPRYKYQIPPDITSLTTTNWYWELMDVVRARPPVPKFVCTPALQGRY